MKHYARNWSLGFVAGGVVSSDPALQMMVILPDEQPYLQRRYRSLQEMPERVLHENVASVDRYLARHGNKARTLDNELLDMRHAWARELARRAGAQRLLQEVFFPGESWRLDS